MGTPVPVSSPGNGVMAEMKQFMNKLERKYGRYAIPNLINYLMVLYTIGTVLGVFAPGIYYAYLSLDISAILHGQVWRLFTFLLEPYGIGYGTMSFVNILFFLIKINIFLMIGRSLENAWGTFWFNIYFLSGYLLSILAAVVMFMFKLPFPVGFEYIYQAMFFAFALLFPDVQFLLYFIIPIKVKWLALLDAVLLGWQLIVYLTSGYYYIAVAILIALGNFLVFFFSTRNYRRISPREIKRKRRYKRQVARASQGARHKCSICGRTELDDDRLEFRYCSKCEGNYEFCSDHLYTHTHFKKRF